MSRRLVSKAVQIVRLLHCIPLIVVSVVDAIASEPITANEWPTVGGDPGGMRYSALADINRDNVHRLKVVWTYRHGDYRSGWPEGEFKGTAFEATPILVEGLLIFSTPFNRVIALDPETGKERWVFDPRIDRNRRYANKFVSRGVAYWRDASTTGHCSSRIFLGTLDARLISLDARTGKPCVEFGTNGTVNLLDGIEPLVDAWEFNVTSPPTVVGDRVIVGSAIADLVRRIHPPGPVRAYDVRTGNRMWRFNTIPQEGEFGLNTWHNDSWRRTGGASVWSTMTADVERGLVYLPVKPAGPDHYGGDRPGENLFSDSLVALDASTGARKWHFQTVHHDLWDYDLAAPPILVRIHPQGRDIDAVVQLTKAGLVFVFDRETGSPVFPIEERPVPRESGLQGEWLSPTQPFPVKPAPLVPQRFAETDLWEQHPHLERCRTRLRTLRNEGIYTPPSETGSILFPGALGGANWSGGAFDPQSGYLYVPTNNLALTLRLKKLPEENYDHTDAIILRSGLRALYWLWRGTGTGLRFHVIEREIFAEGGIPCNRPPWGALTAVDLNRGEIVWQIPIGKTEHSAPESMNLGSALVTAGGLVFHAGGAEAKLRAHDAATGRVLATLDLPAGLHAGPMTYRMRPDGRQFLVVAPGGYVGLSKLGDYIIAYALSD